MCRRTRGLLRAVKVGRVLWDRGCDEGCLEVMMRWMRILVLG